MCALAALTFFNALFFVTNFLAHPGCKKRARLETIETIVYMRYVFSVKIPIILGGLTFWR